MYIDRLQKTIELLRRELHECVRLKQGNLIDDEVIALSQALDVLLVAHTKGP